MASPLSLFMPINPGVNLQQMAAGLGQMSEQLNQALTQVGTVHYARILLLDRSTPNLQPNPSDPSQDYVLAIITEYDGSFEKYISDFVARVGKIFDALLVFVVGGAALIPVVDHQDAFLAYIKANDASQDPAESGQQLYEAYTNTVQSLLALGATPPVGNAAPPASGSSSSS